MTLDRELLAIQADAAVLEANNAQTLEAMHDARLGQPRAAAYDSVRPEVEVWCDEHERPVAKCREQDLFCDGYVLEVHDPTGEAATAAAMGHDRADSDRKLYRGDIEAAAKFLRRARSISERYVPPASVRIPSLTDDELDERWCTSCKRDAGYCEPVSPNYPAKKLCRKCGEFLNEHGVPPPLVILQKRHRGDRIYDRDVDKALGRKAS